MIQSLVMIYIIALVIFAVVKLDDYINDLEDEVRVKHVVMGLIFFPLTLILTIFFLAFLVFDFVSEKVKSEKLNKLWNKKLKEMK